MTRSIGPNDGSDPPDLPADRSRTNQAGTSDLGAHAMRAGERAPHFRLRDQHGRRITLSELLLRGAVVLRFCRNENTEICIREFGSLSALHIKIERLGATLVVIAVEPFDPRPLGKDITSFSFSILPDVNGDVAQSYGLTYEAYETPEQNDASDSPEQPCRTMSAPATYVLDQTGLVVLAFVDVECRSVMDHRQVLVALECLAGRNKS